MTARPVPAGNRDVTALRNAEAEGFSLSATPSATESDCPYTNDTFRDAWLRGFRRGRAAQS